MGRRQRDRGVRFAAAVLGVLALAACQGTDAQPSPDPTSSPAGSPSGPSSAGTPSASTTTPSASTSPTVVVADPEHAVPPPGPRTGPLVPADLLVLSQDTIPADVVSAIAHTKGVTGVASISMANASVEDRLVRVVAAD